MLVIAGDVCPVHDHEIHFQRNWLRTAFYYWACVQPFEHVVWIAGNHDFVCEQPGWHAEGDERIVYLQDNGVEIDGVAFYGTPWVPNLPGWAFYADPPTLQERVDVIPGKLDVLISHGPPASLHDRVTSGMCVGSDPLASRLHRDPPRLTIVGHIHEAWGRTEIGEGRHVANVAYVDEMYEVRPNAAMTFEL